MALRDIRILGLHPYNPSIEELDRAIETWWGADLPEPELDAARERVEAHFKGLFLIRIQVEPPEAEFDWNELTQADAEQPRSNWQVPYDERPVDRNVGQWMFFLHYVDVSKPMVTPLGERPLPPPTPCPSQLASMKYEIP